MTVLSVNQPCYMPWCGLFERIARADVHVHLDDVQYVRQTYFNRNRIIDRTGKEIMLTVPVSSHLGQNIDQVGVPSDDFVRKHRATLSQCYAGAAYIACLDPLMAVIQAHLTSLADLNVAVTETLATQLGIKTPMVRASALGIAGHATGRLVALCRHFGADTYYSPAGAKQYLQPEEFAASNINLQFQQYTARAYPQGKVAGFVANLSVVDPLLRHGPANTLTIVHAGAAGGLHG